MQLVIFLDPAIEVPLFTIPDIFSLIAFKLSSEASLEMWISKNSKSMKLGFVLSLTYEYLDYAM